MTSVTMVSHYTEASTNIVNQKYDVLNLDSRIKESEIDLHNATKVENMAIGNDLVKSRKDKNDYLVLFPDEAATSEITARKIDNAYCILDPNETGFNRSRNISKQNAVNESKDTDRKDINENCYVFAKPFGENLLTRTGGYDSLESTAQNLHCENVYNCTDNVYSHAVDNVYDSTTHCKSVDMSDNTYDHFFGEKTEDEYDVASKY